MAVWVVDSAGEVLGGEDTTRPSSAELAAVRATIATAKPQICDPFRTADGMVAICYATLATPVDRAGPTGISGDAHQVVILRSNPAGSLFGLVESQALGSGRERSRLLARIGGEVVVFSPSGDPPLPLRHRWPAAQVPDVVRRALDGQVATGSWTDVGGELVMGGARPWPAPSG